MKRIYTKRDDNVLAMTLVIKKKIVFNIGRKCLPNIKFGRRFAANPI